MSIHSSLRSGGKGRHRSVLKRYERLNLLKEKHLWDETKPVLGIPKVKMQKLRVKKEKAAPETADAGAGAPQATAPAGQAAAAPKAAPKAEKPAKK